MKKTTQYLYGISAEEFRDMSYVDALEHKILSGKELLNTLVAVNFNDRDNKRIQDVLSAIKFNKELLLEVEGWAKKS